MSYAFHRSCLPSTWHLPHDCRFRQLDVRNVLFPVAAADHRPERQFRSAALAEPVLRSLVLRAEAHRQNGLRDVGFDAVE